MVTAALFVLAGCSSGSSSPIDARRDTAHDREVDAAVTPGDDGPADVGANHEVGKDGPAQVGNDAPSEAGIDAPAQSDAAADAPADVAASDAPLSLPTGLRWVALPAPQGTPIAAVTLDSGGALFAGANDDRFVGPGAGIFRSMDDGVTWQPVNLGVYDYHVGGLFADGPNVYAGTAGLLRSTDRGASWMQVTPPSSVGLVSAIGEQGNLAMVASSYGGDSYFTSHDGGKTFQASQYAISSDIKDIVVLGSVILRADDSGVTRSTDGGITFVKVQGINNYTLIFASLACDGVQTCYANAHDAGEFDPNVLLKSTDAGATWTPLGLTNAPVLAVSDTGILYVEQSMTIARSDDGGASFTPLARPTMSGTFEPNCSGPYMARGDRLFAGCRDGVYRSNDRGQHWQPLSGSTAGRITGSANLIFTDVGATALGPTGDIYVIGNHGSNLQRSTDGGWTWQTLAAPFSAFSCVVTGSGAIECAGARTSNGPSGSIPLARSEDHGATWKSVPLPAGPTTSPFSAVALAAAGSVVYAVGQGAARSDDDGRTFQLLTGGPSVKSLQLLRDGHLLAGASVQYATYRSKDQGVTWQTLPRTFPVPSVEDAQGRLLFVDSGGEVSASTDEGDTWQTLSVDGVPYVNGVVMPMAVDGAGRLFMFGPGAAPDIHFGRPLESLVSLDSGATWRSMTPQIPNPNTTGFATDKQGRLLVGTTGGVFRLDDSSMPGPPAPDAWMGGSDGGATATPPRALSLVLENGPWAFGGGGIAADSSQRVYLADNLNVYVVNAGTASTWLTHAEAATAAGLVNTTFDDIDVGADGSVYAVLSGTPPGGASVDVIVQSSAADQATLWRNLGTLTSPHMKAAGTGKVGLIDRNGFSIATSTSTQLVYPSAMLMQSCATAQMAIDSTGAVVFPSCSASALRGSTGGAPLSPVFQLGGDPLPDRIACFTDDPAGGFFFLVTDDLQQSPRLYHVAPGASGAMALEHVVTEPSFGEVRVARSGGQEFASCAMATAPNGVIYVVTQKDLWKVGL
jgi:photosystem II stability/assembly factor-like uncharacterized protein